MKNAGAGDFNALIDRLLTEFPADNLFWITPDTPRVYAAAIELIRGSGGELNFNDALIALACRDYGIPFLASFDPDYDRLPWLKRISRPEDTAASASPPLSG